MTQIEPTRLLIEAAPSAVVVGATVAGYSFSDWAAIVGIFFLLMQIAYLIWRWSRDLRIDRERRARQDADHEAGSDLEET